MRAQRDHKLWVRWLTVPALVLGVVVGSTALVHADDPEAALRAERQRLEELQRQREQAQTEFAQTAAAAEEAQAMLSVVEAELNMASGRLADLEADLSVAEAKLQELESQLEEAEERCAKRKELLGRRIRSIHENGRVSYLAVLLGSETFSEFISRFEVMKQVLEKDAELFAQVREDKQQLADQREEAAARKEQLAALKTEAESHREAVAYKHSQRETVSRTLDSRKRELADWMAAMEQEEELVSQRIAQIQQEMNRVQDPGGFSPIYPVTPVYVTDPFGWRTHPIFEEGSMHHGVDLGLSMYQPIYAIESGQVIIAEYSGIYGYYVVIDHGGGISSLYGHASSLLVSAGETVSRGQQIARGGSTGISTGPHLHLEIKINGQAQNPMSYLP